MAFAAIFSIILSDLYNSQLVQTEEFAQVTAKQNAETVKASSGYKLFIKRIARQPALLPG